jgi:hypothetical protein
MATDSDAEGHLSERSSRPPPPDIYKFLGLPQDKAPGWVIEWSLAPPDWATVRHPDMSEDLCLRVKVASTEEGVGIEAVLIERKDGRAISARDLRRVKLPPAWSLASNLERLPGSPMLSQPRPGPRGKGDDHWRAVFSLWTRAQRVAPRTPVRWMREQWPNVSDATMRRWVKRARERAETNNWEEEDHA